MRTIGTRYPARSPHGDFEMMCDYCGVYWHRSKMRRDASGYFACPDDRKGLDAVSLARGNMAGAMSMPPIRGRVKR